MRTTEAGNGTTCPRCICAPKAIRERLHYAFIEVEGGRGVDVATDKLSRMLFTGITLNTRSHERVELEWKARTTASTTSTTVAGAASSVLQLVGVGYVTAAGQPAPDRAATLRNATRPCMSLPSRKVADAGYRWCIHISEAWAVSSIWRDAGQSACRWQCASRHDRSLRQAVLGS